MISNSLYIKYVMPANDMGLIMYLIHSQGPIFVCLIVGFLILRCFPIDRYSIGSFFILLLGKISLFSPFAPALLYFIFYRDKLKKDEYP